MIGRGNRVRVVDVADGAALVRIWEYRPGGYTQNGVKILIVADQTLGLCVYRVPWTTETIEDARTFLTKYRFRNVAIGRGRENQLRRKPYVAIAG